MPPGSQKRLQLRDRAPDQVDVASARHRPDVRQRQQRRQCSAAEVQAVELHIGGSWVSASATSTSAAPSTCPTAGPDDRDIARRAGNLSDQ